MQRCDINCGHMIMKTIVSLGILAIFVVSCKKDNPAELRTNVSGTWELRRSPAFFGSTLTYPAGNGRIIVLGEDGAFERRSHDTVLARTRYFLVKKKDCDLEEKQVFFGTEDGYYSSDHQVISRNNDTLYIGTSSCLLDGGTGIYYKL